MISSNMISFTTKTLEPCQNYKIFVEPFLGLNSSWKTKSLDVGKYSTISLTTQPDKGTPFVMRSIRNQPGRTFVKISFLTEEWPCMDISVDLCPEKSESKW